MLSTPVMPTQPLCEEQGHLVGQLSTLDMIYPGPSQSIFYETELAHNLIYHQ